MSVASRSDRARRSSFVTTRTSPARHAASASRGPAGLESCPTTRGQHARADRQHRGLQDRHAVLRDLVQTLARGRIRSASDDWSIQTPATGHFCGTRIRDSAGQAPVDSGRPKTVAKSVPMNDRHTGGRSASVSDNRTRSRPRDGSSRRTWRTRTLAACTWRWSASTTGTRKAAPHGRSSADAGPEPNPQGQRRHPP
jgi:hypothetical protein